MTPESKMMRRLSGDIISNLPRDVIDNILTCLHLREAGRTSILSRSWRYMWANLPALVFDDNTFAGTTQKSQDKLLFAIHEVLLLKHVPILYFNLSLPGLKSCRQIDPFVSFLSRSCGLREFTLHILEGDERYKLQPLLFSCLELTQLSLQHCVIEPPIWFKGFNRLVSLEISNCSILPDVLSSLISTCPLLEELMVTSHTPVKDQIQISAPNLRYLYLTGQFASILFKCTPSLSSCALFLHDNSTPVTTSNVFQSFHKLLEIKHLYIDYYYAEHKTMDRSRIPRKLATTLTHLKSLNLWRISFSLLYEVSGVLCLIRSSPNLTKIAFHKTCGVNDVTDVDVEQVSHVLEVHEWSGIYLNRLREVKVEEITGEATELRFIELLLAISPKLEKMIVTSIAPDVTLEKSLEISTKITRFRRSSPLAEIIYKH